MIVCIHERCCKMIYVMWASTSEDAARLQAGALESQTRCIANFASSSTSENKQSSLGQSVGRSNCDSECSICMEYRYRPDKFTRNQPLDEVCASSCTTTIAHICRFCIIEALTVHNCVDGLHTDCAKLFWCAVLCNVSSGRFTDMVWHGCKHTSHHHVCGALQTWHEDPHVRASNRDWVNQLDVAIVVVHGTFAYNTIIALSDSLTNTSLMWWVQACAPLPLHTYVNSDSLRRG